jgi:hypothetical protein
MHPGDGAGGLLGCAPRLDESRPYGTIPDASGPSDLRAPLARVRATTRGLGGFAVSGHRITASSQSRAARVHALAS